jgi:hypothetical protein
VRCRDAPRLCGRARQKTAGVEKVMKAENWYQNKG